MLIITTLTEPSIATINFYFFLGTLQYLVDPFNVKH